MVKKSCAVFMFCLFCLLTVPAFALGSEAGANSISPHAEGVCAPNDMIIQAEEPEDTEPVAAKEQEPAEDEPTQVPEEDMDEDLTIEEMVRANRDPDSEVWYHMEDQDCPGHEWEYCYDDPNGSFRACLNCGCTEPVEDLEEALEASDEALDSTQDEPEAETEPEEEGEVEVE